MKIASLLLPLFVFGCAACGAAAPAPKTPSANAADRAATYVTMQGYGLVVDACTVVAVDPKLSAVSAKCDELLPIAHDLIEEAFLVVQNRQPFGVGTACNLAKAVDTLSTLGMMLPLKPTEKAVLKDADELAKALSGFCAADAGAE